MVPRIKETKELIYNLPGLPYVASSPRVVEAGAVPTSSSPFAEDKQERLRRQNATHRRIVSVVSS